MADYMAERNLLVRVDDILLDLSISAAQLFDRLFYRSLLA